MGVGGKSLKEVEVIVLTSDNPGAQEAPSPVCPHVVCVWGGGMKHGGKSVGLSLWIWER